MSLGLIWHPPESWLGRVLEHEFAFTVVVNGQNVVTNPIANTSSFSGSSNKSLMRKKTQFIGESALTGSPPGQQPAGVSR